MAPAAQISWSCEAECGHRSLRKLLRVQGGTWGRYLEAGATRTKAGGDSGSFTCPRLSTAGPESHCPLTSLVWSASRAGSPASRHQQHPLVLQHPLCRRWASGISPSQASRHTDQPRSPQFFFQKALVACPLFFLLIWSPRAALHDDPTARPRGPRSTRYLRAPDTLGRAQEAGGLDSDFSGTS